MTSTSTPRPIRPLADRIRSTGEAASAMGAYLATLAAAAEAGQLASLSAAPLTPAGACRAHAVTARQMAVALEAIAGKAR